MDIKQALETVERYNEWRRTGEGDMLPPKIVGEAIDTVCGELRRLTTLRPMSEAPVDEWVLLKIKYEDEPVLAVQITLGHWQQNQEHIFVDGDACLVDDLDETVSEYAEGWLPLPEVSE